MTACSPDPLEAYFGDVEGIIATMRTDSLAATPRAGAITRDGINGVTSARRDAVSALSAVVPPNEVRPEHIALLESLADLVEASDDFMAGASGMDDDAFQQAALEAVDLRTIVQRVGLACNALENRADTLQIEADIRC